MKQKELDSYLAIGSVAGWLLPVVLQNSIFTTYRIFFVW